MLVRKHSNNWMIKVLQSAKKFFLSFETSCKIVFCRLRNLEVQKVGINKLHPWYFLIKVTEKVMHNPAFIPTFYVACIIHAIMSFYRHMRQMQ